MQPYDEPACAVCTVHPVLGPALQVCVTICSLIAAALALLAMSGCTATLPPIASVYAIDAPEMTPQLHRPMNEMVLAPGACRDDKTCYRMRVVLDFAGHQLEVEEIVDYANRTDHTLNELKFVVEPNRTAGVFQLAEITNDAGVAVAGVQLRGAVLTAPLAKPLQPGERVALTLRFHLFVPNQRSFFGFTGRQLNLGDWYPQVAPLDQTGAWLIHPAAAVGEHLVYDIADYTVALSGDALDDLTIAASAPAQMQNGKIVYWLPDARTFALSASLEYQVLSETIQGTTVTSYLFPEHAAAGAAALEATVQAMLLYSELFGAYPHSSLSAVEADFVDGMEYDGLYFLGKEYYAAYVGNPAGYLTLLAAHETAHQWWFASVGNDQALEPFLDEALATYSELLFYERTAPELVDWWWQYRVGRFDPQGCVSSTIYEYKGFRAYVNAVYLRGALLLRDLRAALGDDAFFRALKGHATRHAGSQATTVDWVGAFEEQVSGDLSEILAQYCVLRGQH